MSLYHKFLFVIGGGTLLIALVGYLAFSLEEEAENDLLRRTLVAHAEAESAFEMLSVLLRSQVAIQELVEEHHSLQLQDSTQIQARIIQAQGFLQEQQGRFEQLLTRAQSMARQHAETVVPEEAREAEREALALLQEVETAFLIYQARSDTLMRLLTADLVAGDRYLDDQLEPIFRLTLVPILRQYREGASQDFEQGSAALRDSLTWTHTTIFLALIFGVLLAVSFGGLLAKYLMQPLRRLTKAAHAVRRGKLKGPIDIRSNDEIGNLATTFNQMIDDLSKTMVSKHYIDNIIQSMADTLIVVDMNGHIRTVNEALTRLLGFSKDEVVGVSLADLFHEPAPKVEDLLSRIQRIGRVTNVRMNYRTEDAGRINVSLSGALMRNGSPKPIGMVCVAHDITTRIQYETQLIEARREAEELVHMKDVFVQTMSHELRTPLTGILGATQILKEELDSAHELVEILELSGLRLLDTLNAVLDLAQIEAGKMQPNLVPVSVTPCAKRAVQALQPLATQKGLKLELEAEPGETQALLDQVFLARVLDNVIDNAIKFTDTGEVVVSVESDDSSVRIHVRDTGIGISEAYLPQIFDTFMQESSGLTRNHEGNGLGLAIAKRLVELMDGQIGVSSVKGAGSTFTLCFPRYPVASGQAPQPTRAENSPTPSASVPPQVRTEEGVGSRRREGTGIWQIMLLEDDLINQDLISRFLSDHHLTVAATPAQALALGKQEAFDLIMLDINLGTEETGEDVLRALRQMPRHAQTPVIAMTAYAMTGDKDRFLEAGFDGYLSKPYTQAQLQETLQQALQKGRG